MKTVNLHFAKTHLSKLVDEAVAGADVVIAKAGKPLVRLVSVATSAKARPLGALAGQVIERGDAWDTDADVEASFYESRVEPTPARRVAERPKPRKA